MTTFTMRGPDGDAPEKQMKAVARSFGAGSRESFTGEPTVRERNSVDVGAFGNDATWDGTFGNQGMVLLSPGKVVADRYRLFERIARGGMGSVWCAIDDHLKREVAIKFMSPELADDPEYRLRFEQEARASAMLASPHVVTVFDSGVADGMPYMVLERLEGEDLHRRLKRAGRLSLAACERILSQVARGLAAAHAAGIVHRDIKPPNIYMAHDVDAEEGDETVKLLDFGVAKHAGTRSLRTKSGILVGSPHFMSPEQVCGVRDVDFRTDLFSLAAVMYRCVTGRLAFDGDISEVMLKISRGTFTPPSRVVVGLPTEVDAFFARALATDPQARFESALAMAKAFRTLVQDEQARRAGAIPLRPETSLRLAGRRSQPPAPFGKARSRSRAISETRPRAMPSACFSGTYRSSAPPSSSGPSSRRATERVSVPEELLPTRVATPQAVCSASEHPTQMLPAEHAAGFIDATHGSRAPSPWEVGIPAHVVLSKAPTHPRRLVAQRGLGALVAMMTAVVGVLLVFLLLWT